MKERIKKVLEANLILLLIFVAYYIINKYTGIYIPCMFHEITGYKCPGCGITHLLFDLVNFRFVEAFKDNPLLFIYLPFIIAYYIYMTYLYIYNKKDKIIVKIPDYIWGILIAITIIYGIVRNIIGI